MSFLLLMPSYNQSHYIVEAVRSVLAQDDPDWELWIVDNSTDRTPQVMRQFADPRIRFHHIAERMDPGSCLNWMLERAIGRDFSYIHTDNNLHPSYVRRMREALAEHPLALAYCDMRTIDQRGRCLNIYRRGSFDLPRLLSVDSLGVPFAATTELAKQIGGFSVRDFADDVRFCVSAYGLAQYVYIPHPLIDYRLHGQSRTEEAGGAGAMQRVFADQMLKIIAVLERRGITTGAELERSIKAEFAEIDMLIGDIWYRKFSRSASAWWFGLPKIDDFFFNGLLDVPGFGRGFGGPKCKWRLTHNSRDTRIWPWQIFFMRITFYMHRRKYRAPLRRAKNLLIIWARLRLGADMDAAGTFRIRTFDFRTVWAARQLELSLGWQPKIESSAADVPGWLPWGRAEGSEPLLDCAVLA